MIFLEQLRKCEFVEQIEKLIILDNHEEILKNINELFLVCENLLNVNNQARKIVRDYSVHNENQDEKEGLQIKMISLYKDFITECGIEP